MKIDILCAGKIKEAFYRDALNEYAKRLGKYCKINIYEVKDEQTPDRISDKEKNKILGIEGERIRKYIDDRAFLCVLAIEGKKYSSESFASMLKEAEDKSIGKIQFVIGGSLGLDESIKKQADASISFSDMTFPHQLMRVILLEQIYRSYRIRSGEPYHK